MERLKKFLSGMAQVIGSKTGANSSSTSLVDEEFPPLQSLPITQRKESMSGSYREHQMEMSHS